MADTDRFPSHPPLRTGPWVMAMRWQQLLFAHWPVPADWLRPHLPAGLELDLWEGQAWLAVVPFRMTGVRPRVLPPVPGPSAFCELNLRTYVRPAGGEGGVPGVWFFSLDAADWLAVRAARATFRLPYFDARMSLAEDADGWIDYRSERTHRGVVAARFAGRYRPVGEPFRATAGSLEEFLTERYCLYTTSRRGRIRRGDIEHAPWPLQHAEWQPRTCEMAGLIGRELPDAEPHLLFARDLPVRAWWPVTVPD